MLTTELAGGPVHLSALPVEGVAGEIVLVHDLSFLGRREATTRNILLVAFFVLALGGPAVTFLAARFAWRGWTADLRRALHGGEARGRVSAAGP
jgi:trehalose 6-phosphate synthase